VTDPIAVLRAIIRDELAGLRLPEIAVVTSAFPREGEGDTPNHQASVKLREGDGLELRQVPIATPHVGEVSAPQPGELVLLAYVGGDANRPVIAGRLYSEKARVPLHAASGWRVEAPLGGTTSIAIDKDANVVVTAGKTVLTVRKDGNIEIAGEADLKIEAKGKIEISCTDAKIAASGNIELGEGGAGVITEASHKCYFTGKPLKPSQTVKAKG
jgi:phage baseplate assembly protein gpV